ncbi:hypothetical protein KC331_g6834 [Hortaea werneckii]|uniref:Calcofluor white hypersensitive protein n=1 Tax=Hortaea werneckii TaxID=91943 RepID=A0A3M7CG81_HORWE|nr:hypothetical protein KC331_g6834 [Hortaea werneckii]KAI7719353.1 hypothetical protein KC353_g3056 [Hortaea werneckii]RMY51148.1 hypothetical protein D0865_06510 [Hortaea werneckii]
MSSRRFWQITGSATLAGVGYYLYNAGGQPDVAEKKFEADATKLSKEVRSHLPGSGTQAQKEAEASSAQAGQKLDQVVQDAKQGMSKVDSKLEAYRNQAEKGLDQNLAEARKGANNAIDSFDRNVSEGASKAKSGINSWFGGGSK